jgi:hypothetical protein
MYQSGELVQTLGLEAPAEEAATPEAAGMESAPLTIENRL